MTTPPQTPSQLAGLRDGLLIFALLLMGLTAGSSLLIPIAIALLVFVLLMAIVEAIAGFKIGSISVPTWAAHVIAIFLVLLGFYAVLQVLSLQAGSVAEAVPRYEARFDKLISDIVKVIGEAAAEDLSYALNQISFSSVTFAAVNGATTFLSALFLVLLYVPFLMVEQRFMSQKLLAGAGDAALARQIENVIAAITKSLRTYVGVKTLVSALTGLFSYAVMKIIGLDFAETWAVLAFFLNFIPSIGSVLGVLLPAMVALVQFDTLTPFLVVGAGLGVVQFSIGNILEPRLMGRSLNLSPLMVILALTFWTSIWGIPGAFLSVPITVCVLIILSHVPATRPLAIMMSESGALNSDTSDMDHSDAG